MKPTRFRRIEELEEALEEYAAFQDGVALTKFRETRGAGGIGNPGHDFGSWHERVLRQNMEVDRRMKLLYRVSPLLWKIVDLYYRRGLCYEANGWRLVAERCGLPSGYDKTKVDDEMRSLFEEQASLAVRYLWRVYQFRRECA